MRGSQVPVLQNRILFTIHFHSLVVSAINLTWARSSSLLLQTPYTYEWFPQMMYYFISIGKAL